jgi:uncharacterized protein (TIGR03435 family)
MRLKIAAFSAIFAALSYAQTSASPTFEAASIKSSNVAEGTHGSLFPSGGNLTGVNMPLRQYVAWAYGTRSDLVVGPDWLSTHFDVLGKAQGPVPLDQMRAMLRRLLEERFHLAGHRETKQMTVYALVVAKDGPRNLDVAAPETTQLSKPSPVKGDVQHWSLAGESMADFAFFLGKLASLDLPTVDLTGISGKFNFEFDVPLPDPETKYTDYGLSYVSPAIRKQLGLFLESKKAPMEVVVVDRIDRTPIDN